MDRPLKGVRVVEVAMWVAGPSTTTVLGDWGADIIKLEDPATGDPIRGFVTRTMGDPNARIRPPFELDNRNKRSVAVDLRRPDGHAFALKLIEHADVFVTSLRLDALERMKLDYASLAAKNPRLIYGSINGYGHRGPDRNRPAYDYAASWARSGLMATIAEPGQSPPGQRPAMIDHAVGLGLAGAISAALLARERSGRGREVNISLFSMGLWMNASDLTIGLMTGHSPQSESRTERINPMWSSYRCADARWIYFVMIQSDRYWPDFCLALGKPDWQNDPRFKDSVARAQNCAALTDEIDRAIALRSLRRLGADFRSPQSHLGARSHRRRSARRSAGRSYRRFRRRGPSEYSRMPRREQPRRVWRRRPSPPSCGARTRPAYRGSRA